MSALVPIVRMGTGKPPSVSAAPSPRDGALKLPAAATSAAHLCSPARDLQRAPCCEQRAHYSDHTRVC